MRFLALAVLIVATRLNHLSAQQPADWTTPHESVRIFGNTYYVGTLGLGSILITSPQGDVLIDAGVAEDAPLIERNIERLGFHLRDVKAILNSHAHYDHSGGIAELQRASGARVEALRWSAQAMKTGAPGRDDPQFGIVRPDMPRVSNVKIIEDGDTVRVGALAVVAHKTAGHTPSGTTWTWKSCERDRCLDIVYADSQTPVSADDFYFTRSKVYPNAIADFEHGFSVLEHLRCDILLTPHPGVSSLWQRVAKRDAGDAGALIDPAACRHLAADGRQALAKRIEKEKKGSSNR
jgi:metallo-beta-lactamase class B